MGCSGSSSPMPPRSRSSSRNSTGVEDVLDKTGGGPRDPWHKAGSLKLNYGGVSIKRERKALKPKAE